MLTELSLIDPTPSSALGQVVVAAIVVGIVVVLQQTSSSAMPKGTYLFLSPLIFPAGFVALDKFDIYQARAIYGGSMSLFTPALFIATYLCIGLVIYIFLYRPSAT